MKYIFFLLAILIFLSSCKKKSNSNDSNTYKLSDDICNACANTYHYTIVGEDTLLFRSIITPNNDIHNDEFNIKYLDTIRSPEPDNLTIFNRIGKQIIHFDNYKNSWPSKVPPYYQQDISGLSNGLYRYLLKKGSNNIEGYFIILTVMDNYIDMNLNIMPCHACMNVDYDDPLFFIGNLKSR